MATRSLNVVISGDAKQLGVATRQADGHLGKLEKSGVKAGKMLALGFATAGAAAGGALVLGLKKSVDAAKEAEKSQARMEAQLKASGASYRAHAKEIDAVIQKHSKLAGVDDEDLQDAFTGIVRATGSVSTAMKDMGLVTDLMRGKNMDAAKAGDLLAKVHNGNVAALKRMGIAVDPVTKATDKLKESNKHATAEQIAAAKATDKQATAQKGIAELQKRFGGQAEAYGKTAAGAQERLGVAVENLQEKIGAKLLPIVAQVTNKIANFVGQMESGKGAGGRFAAIVTNIATAIGGVIGKVSEFGSRIAAAFSGGDKGASSSVSRIVASVRSLVKTVVSFVTELASRIKTGFSGISGDLATIAKAWLWLQSIVVRVISEIAKRVLPILGSALGGVATVIRGLVKIIAGLLSGDFRKAWEGVKIVVKAQLDAAKGIIRGAWDNLGPAMVSLAKFLIRALGSGLKALPGALKDALVASIELAARNVPKLIGKALGGLGKAITAGIKAGFDKLNPLGDGLGSGDGIGMSIPSIGRFGGGLKGARPSMAPFAAAGARFGLGVSSGRRPGAITSSGNVSYHSTGEAIDVAGPPTGMLAYFRYLKNTAGGRLAELIYTPGGAGIKNGKPYTYGGQVAADHFDHVHVAFDSGAPGVGDGIGQAASAARSAGFRGDDLVEAVAIAGAETGGTWDAQATNFKYPDHSVGFWQINQLAHKGRFGTDAQLKNPVTNAKAAYALFKERGFRPWSTYPAAARAYLEQARAAISGTSGSSGGGSGGSSSGGGASGPRTVTYTASAPGGLLAPAGGTIFAGPKEPKGLVGPGKGDYGQRLADIGLARVEADGDTQKTIALVYKEAVEKQTRLAAIKAALKRRLKKETRKRLTEEATQLIADLKALSALMYDLTGGQSGISSDGIQGGTPAAAADIASKAGGGGGGTASGSDTSSSSDQADAGPTQADSLTSAVARARLTDGTDDDIAALTDLLGFRKGEMETALADGDPRNDESAISAFLEVKDALTTLTGATKADADAKAALTEALKGVQDEIKRNTDFAQSVTNTSNFQLTKTLADLVSGQIVGYGVAGRAFTPGVGVDRAY